MNKMPNTLFLISSPSGSGKTSIMRAVMDNEVVSFTTRAIREGEIDGIDYLFIEPSKFNDLKVSGGLIESVEYSGNHYGITAEELQTKLCKGNAFSIVDFHGMKQLREIYPDTVTIFIKTSKEDAIRNMLQRGDSFGNIAKRLVTFDKELENRIYYDYVVTNVYGKMDETIDVVKKIVDTYA